MDKDNIQQELDIDLGDQPTGDETPERTETFGERIDRNIKAKTSTPKDPNTHSEPEYSEGDDLAEWHLRHRDPENP